MVDVILSKIKKAVDDECSYDKTFTANIVTKPSDTRGLVSYKGTTHTVQSTIPFENGDLVRVCVPCNNWNDLFIVENRTTSQVHNKK